MSEFVFLNDRLVEADEARVSIYDAGLLHGVGLFETMRSYNGMVFRLAEHLERLYRSAQALGIPVTQKQEEIAGWVQVLLDTNGLREARLRLTLTRGSIKDMEPDNPAPSVMFITAAPMAGYPREYYEKGMTVTVSDYKQNPADPLAGHKTTNYFGRLLALQEAQRKQAGEALWFTTSNRLAEGCVSNVFLVKDDKLLTPPPDTPVLPGIVRQVVLEAAQKNEIKFEERHLDINDLLGAKEVILTNSIMELMPVCRIERHAVGGDKPGLIYKRLHELYQAAVQEETAR